MNILLKTITVKGFEVGQGATVCLYSDRLAGTIIEVNKSGKTVRWREDNYKITKGSTQDGSAEYEYTPSAPNENREYTFTLRKNGRFIRKGDDMTGITLIPGRSRYHDPTF